MYQWFPDQANNPILFYLKDPNLPIDHIQI